MILILKMKHGDYPVFARDVAERDRAYLHLFKLQDSHGFYSHGLNEDEAIWYKEAKQGNAESARWLLNCHSSDYEYEEIKIIYPVEP